MRICLDGAEAGGEGVQEQRRLPVKVAAPVHDDPGAQGHI
jgi:hypothetical protein